MVKKLACRDAGYKCSFEARGETVEEVLKNGAEHVKSVHGIDMADMKPEEIARLKTLIKEA